jgi:hypothetical protein
MRSREVLPHDWQRCCTAKFRVSTGRVDNQASSSYRPIERKNYYRQQQSARNSNPLSSWPLFGHPRESPEASLLRRPIALMWPSPTSPRLHPPGHHTRATGHATTGLTNGPGDVRWTTKTRSRIHTPRVRSRRLHWPRYVIPSLPGGGANGIAGRNYRGRDLFYSYKRSACTRESQTRLHQ